MDYFVVVRVGMAFKIMHVKAFQFEGKPIII
jgi:hypothetical protein